ncbi:MAG: hypothetical protein WCA06_20000, partial [Terrimicrobiaceae bacterium]
REDDALLVAALLGWQDRQRGEKGDHCKAHFRSVGEFDSLRKSAAWHSGPPNLPPNTWSR